MNPVALSSRPALTPAPPAPFAKPSPGSWTLDAAHCERPMPRLAHEAFSRSFAKGFREGMAHYGGLLETIECAFVNGFVYTCVRPLGAPPESKGLPPKPIFKLLTRLHPAFRKRLKRAARVWQERPWREETRRYLMEWMPAMERETARLLRVTLPTLDDAGLERHLAECHRLALDETFLHHRINCTRIVPVGDFMAHVAGWTGAGPRETLAALRGCSPDSRTGDAERERLAGLIRADGDLSARLRSGGDDEGLLAGLETRSDAIGEAARAWIGAIGHQLTGFSPGYPTLREMPATLMGSLRESLAGGAAHDDAAAAGRNAVEALRRRVPAEARAEFDALLEEARHVYFLRDHACLRSLGMFGTMRLAALEAGRRLAARGRIPEPEAALDADLAELTALLSGKGGPSSEELAARLAWRRSATADLAPEILGPVPGDPPPADWLPAGGARLFRAIDIYINAMFGEAKQKNEDKALVRGLAASAGKRRGTARLVLEPGDFDKVGKGDVLIARITTPSYNVLLPLLAGIVTDRGGILSHPAIVSREFGIPGVVGTRNATRLIPDGATVDIDGEAGTVRVLA